MNEQEVREKIDHLKTLEKDWDSYGGDPITLEALTNIEPLVKLEPYFVSPTPDGGLGLEWQHPTWHLEVGVEPDGSYGYLFVPRENGRDVKEGWVEKDNISLEELKKVIKEGL